MGVPKFFRYISERYPCLSELIRENQVPEFDNLYLDMNGIIHNCSHPNDSDVHFRISEEQIFKDIFHYLEFLFRMIRPQKLFFIAIDGVAPRAKMNQQRGRRFRSAKDAEEQVARAEKSGDILPTEERFDSNCITPGTAFMVRLQNALRHFVQVKISTNPLWKHCTVILSGHETPGEGEHKIMEYIRYAKSKPGFDPNTRHCLYGLDADLIMLGLCTHERHFSLLREEVKFGKNDKKTSLVEETRFYLLHLSLLREYLELEFSAVRNKISFKFDIEKLIDDWILMGYLVGNDFIPHLPHLHINENALPTLYQAYMDVLPQIDGYINEGGILNLTRFEAYMNRLGEFDRNVFLEHYADLKYLESKRSADNTDAFDINIDEIRNEDMDMDLSALIQATEDMYNEDQDIDIGDINDPEFFEEEFRLYKRNYYITKLKYEEMTPEVIAEQTECYIRALQWTLCYYYRGVQSWAWYYPHHYAPFISDVQSFKHLKITFEMGKPFLPFQQLLSVLPAASKSHLPTAYHFLMTDPSSPVIDYYPENFENDLNGKQQAWEAVVLIPFIDEKRLLSAMAPCDEKLLPEEKARNIHGPMLEYKFTEASQDSLEMKHGFAFIKNLKCKTRLIYRDDLHVHESQLVLGPSKGSNLDCYYPGFPTMKHLPYFGELKQIRVKVFNQPSRNDSMVIVLDNPVENYKETSHLAKDLNGKVAYVSWPHLTEAKIVKVSDKSKIYYEDGHVDDNNSNLYTTDCRNINEHHMQRLGIDLGKIEQLVHVLICTGHEYYYNNNTYTLRKLWSSTESTFPVHAMVTNLKTLDAGLQPVLKVSDVFSPGSTVFLLGTEHYGSMGQAIETIAGKNKIKASFTTYEEPDFKEAIKINEEAKRHYMNSYDAASSIGISANSLNRITSSIFVVPGVRRSLLEDEPTKQNVGLQLRLVKREEETIGYTKKHSGRWLFSAKVVDLIGEYYDKLPKLFEMMESGGRSDMFFEEELFTGTDLTLKQLVAWVKKLPHTKAERRSCGTDMMEKEAIENIIETMEERKKISPKGTILFVSPQLLYKPELKSSATPPDPKTDFELFDRVIIARCTEVMPLGFRGTIIGIHFVKDPNPVRRDCLRKVDKYFDVLFDEKFTNGTSVHGLESARERVARVSEAALINISYGHDAYDNMKDNNYKYNQQTVILPPDFTEIIIPNQIPIVNHSRNKSGAFTTADDIRKRLNDRIEKKNPNKNISIMNRVEAHEDASGSTKSREDFEKIWSKLKEMPQPLFLEQIENNKSLDLELKPEVVVKKTEENIEPQKTNTDNSTDMLKKMLKINFEEKEDEKVEKKAETMSAKPTSSHESHQKVNLEDMFKMHNKKPIVVPQVDNLPTPPLTWRSNWQSNKEPEKPNNLSQPPNRQPPNQKVQQPHLNNIFPHFMNQQISPVAPNLNMRHPVMNFMPPQMPVHNFPQYNRIIPPQQIPPPNYQPQQQFQNNFQHRQFQMPPQHANFYYNNNNNNQNADGRQKPNGPQNLSYNRNVPGNGAFVPLQAAIKSVKQKMNQMNTQPGPSSQTTSVTFAQKNAEQRQIVEQKQEEVKQSFASFLAQDPVAVIPTPEVVSFPVKVQVEAETIAPPVADSSLNVMAVTSAVTMVEKKVTITKPRQSRIAAKFTAS